VPATVVKYAVAKRDPGAQPRCRLVTSWHDIATVRLDAAVSLSQNDVEPLRQLKARGDTIEPGDVIMHNDPYGGVGHGPDVAFVVPVFYRDELIGFAVTTAHHLDIGALSPGSCGIVDAMDVYAEGLQFKAVKVYQRG
jgi:N-methylhydantoinase B/oxoprolinase/acetone carboxylase alpha subunit